MPHDESKQSPRQDDGFSLIEVALAVIIVVVPTSWMVIGIVTAGQLKIRSEMRFRALEAAQTTQQEILATPIDQVWSTYGPGGSIGPTFSVPLLDGNELAGSVEIVTDETVADAELPLPIGMPQDLNGDDVVDNTDVSTGAMALPVFVTITWGPADSTESLTLPVIVLR